MGVEGCGKCMKYSMFIANALIAVGAITVMAVGIWTLLDKSYLENFLGTNLYKSSASILIAMGVTVLLIAFLGCIGAIREIKCMLLTYFIILFLIFIILLIGGVLAYVFRDKVENTVNTEMKKSVEDYGNTDAKGKVVTDAWDNTQRKFKCCGVARESGTSNNMSWQIWKLNSNVGKGLPPSCCADEKDCGNKDTAPTDKKFYTTDCVSAVASYFKGHAIVLGGVGIGISCIMVLGIAFSISLFKMIE